MINNRTEALKELERLHEWFRNQDVNCKFNNEELYLNTLNLLRKYLFNPISLADFLGWKEKEIYQKDNCQYQIRDNKLYGTSLGTEDWWMMFDIERITNLQTATKVEIESKFYLQLPILEKDENYLNYDKDKNCIIFADNGNVSNFQTIFTEDEIRRKI